MAVEAVRIGVVVVPCLISDTEAGCAVVVCDMSEDEVEKAGVGVRVLVQTSSSLLIKFVPMINLREFVKGFRSEAIYPATKSSEVNVPDFNYDPSVSSEG